MAKLNIVLAFILLLSAISVVTLQHKARSLFVALQDQLDIARELDVKWGQLQLEQSTLAMHGRIERIAKEELNMKVPTASRIQIVSTTNPDNRANPKGMHEQ